MITWELAILATVLQLGGGAWLQEIFGEIYELFPEMFTPSHWRINPDWGNVPVYHHHVRRRITSLHRKGELVRVARGHYRLTKKGMQRLADTPWDLRKGPTIETDHTEVVVDKRPSCDFCGQPAKYDGRIKLGDRWAYMCPIHFRLLGVGLGPGKSQRLIVEGEDDDG